MEPQDQAKPAHAHLPHTLPLDLDRDLLAADGAAYDRQSHNVSLTKDHTELDPTSSSSLPSSSLTTNPSTTGAKIPSNSSTSTIAGSGSVNPSRTLSSSSLPIPSSPLPPRLPGTPPANPPPRFFTRPYRRTVDHHHHTHHHHGPVHGSAHSSGQNSSSIGVRSAFKDFVMPAQIILVCSILNALWPTLLRIVTTTLEFLALVLSSYSACARRSDECYFLEPLFHDGQEAIYVGTIQWTLRSIFGILFLSGFYLVGRKVQKIWSALMGNRQRPRSFWSPENLYSWILTYPCLLWGFVVRIFPWKITRSRGRSGQSRSAQSRHRRKTPSTPAPQLSADSYRSSSNTRGNTSSLHGYSRKAGASSAVDTDAFSAGSGSESKARSKTKSRKSKGTTEDTLQRDCPLSRATSNPVSRSQMPASNAAISAKSNLFSERDSHIGPKTTADGSANRNDSTSLISGAAHNAVYETADDDGDFISTDRRRRRRAKGPKMNSAANSSESLVKPTVPPNRDQELTSSNSNPPNEPTITSPSRVEATKASPSGAMSDDHYLDIATTQKKTSFKEQAHSQPSVSTSEKAHMPTRANIAATRDKNKEQDKDKIKHSDKDKEKEKDVDMDMDMDIDKKRIKDTIKNNETLLPSLPDNAFVHPIHALNSTSPIVRLKPSHKRSQSAQLPLTSPWSILQSSVPATRSHPSSSLSQMTLSTSHTNSLVSSESSSSMEPSILLNNSNSNSKNDDTRGQSSIWYSPFQSGLDISIESDQEQGKHGSRSFSKPGIQTDLARNQKKLSLGPILPPSSFFESSPRTPRIMPFNQHLSNRTLGVDDWSARTRSSSIAAPMTPLLESECQAPADYFGGSHSVSSSRRGSTENNLTESLLSGRARMFAASDSTIVYPRQTSLHPSNSPQGTNGSDTSFSSPLYSSSSLAPPASALFTSASSPLLGHTTQEPLALTTSMLQDPTVETIPTFVNPWESSYPIRSNHTVSEKFLPFGSSSSLNVTDNSFDRDQDQDRQSSLLRLMNGDSRVGEIDQMDGGSGKQERDDEAEAIRRGFLFPSLAHYTHASMHSVDLPSFRPFPSVEMSLAAAANQPPPLTEDLKYDFVDLSMQDFVRGQTPVPEISQGSTWTEGSEKKPRERHRHGRNRSGHHKSASLSSFFPPMPPVPGVLSSTSPGIQADTVGSLDPLNQLANNQSGESHHHGSQGHVHGRSHSKQGRTQGSTSGRDGEGAPSTSGRRRAGTVQDGHHRSASKHHHHQHVDFSKSKRTPKKEQSV